MRNETELEVDEVLIEEAKWKTEVDKVDELEPHEIIGVIGRLSHNAAMDLDTGNLPGAAARLEDISILCEHWCTIQENSK